MAAVSLAPLPRQNCKPALQNLLQQRFDMADGTATELRTSQRSLKPLSGNQSPSKLPSLSISGQKPWQKTKPLAIPAIGASHDSNTPSVGLVG